MDANNKISKQLCRLDLLRFPLIVGVVFIHAYGTAVDLAAGTVGVEQGGMVVDVVRNFLSQGLARIAVPLFFLMSGYLFFFNFSASLSGYKKKLLGRAKTLLMPFLFWNGLVLLIYFVAQGIPATAKYFSGKSGLVADFGLIELLSAIFGIGRTPIAYQFWFIRDLMLLVLLSPCLHLLKGRLIWLPMTVLFYCWFAEIWPFYAPSVEATFFFAVGGILALRRISLFGMDSWSVRVFFAYIVLAVADAAAYGWSGHLYVHKCAILLGMLAALCITKRLNQESKLQESLSRLGRASFFVFAAHEPLLTIIRKLVYSLLHPQSPWLVLVLYFSIPIAVILTLLALHRSLSTLAPGFMRIVNGGR